MIINPFKTTKSQEENITNKNLENINIKDLQKYLIDNYLENLKNEDKEVLINVIEKYLYNKYSLNDTENIQKVINNIFNKMFGYDILQMYIDNKDISDIRVVKYNDIYIKSRGKWKKTNSTFESETEFYDYVRYCILKNNKNINFDVPMIIVSDKKYNLRIEAGLPPVNVFSPSLVIRIHRNDTNVNLERLFLIDEMINFDIYILLNNFIIKQKNIVICGKGGSGKTTLLRALINKISDNIAITTNEETMELFIEGKNVIQREILENREESKKITLDKLMKHSLVMSNDVIIIGELKGAEALVFFDSIATGHMGLTTVHSDGVYNTLDRLTTLIKRDIKAQSYKEEFVNQMLSSSINYIIFMKDYKVNEIAEVYYDRQKQKTIIKIILTYTKIESKYFENLYYYKSKGGV
ncbi:MAG: ATPase, T2SS/T4P/T4SS family [Clostridia bacterium]|nr:ATPase, T2SS/T4P/T4SS family [Clostridia bacterium]MDD4386306.1 ATPase, T2SS/T4P/T4SS family [Clostridia bacterium]